MAFTRFWPLALVVVAFAILVVAGTRSPVAESGSYPEKPIKMIVGFAAGGSQDLAGRALAKELQQILGQPVPVVNQPGAASMLAAYNVAKSRPDGYTIWFGSAGTLVLKSELQQTEVDFFEDFELIGLTGLLVPAIGVPADSPFDSVQDIVDAARERPGELRWSHNGRGAAFMAMGTSFIAASELDVVGVPFQSAKGMQLALFAGQVDFGMLSESDRLRFGDTKMKVLASMRHSRDGALDGDLPALGELDIPFVAIDSPVGAMVPKGTPGHVVRTLREAVAEAVTRDEFRETMIRLYIPVARINPDEGTQLISEIRNNVQTLLPALKPPMNAGSIVPSSLSAPFAIGLFLVVLIAYQGSVHIRSRKDNRAQGKKIRRAGEDAIAEGVALQPLLLFSGPLLLLMGGYGVLHGWFGYLIATALTGYAVLALFGNRLNTVLLCGTAGAIVFYFIFVDLLGVHDPPGSLLDVSHLFK